MDVVIAVHKARLLRNTELLFLPGVKDVLNFTTGVGDAMCCNLGYGIRSSLGIDYTNYDGDYNGGQIVGTVAGVVTGGPALVKGAAQGAKAIASGAQNLTKCGTALGKLIGNSCFVAGTLVNLSSLPRDLESESNLWSNDDWDMRSNEEDGTSTTSVLRFSAIAAPSRILIPIEQVPLGAQVPTKNPRPWEYDESLPDPIREQWSRIELTYEGDDGRITDIELLRPKKWVQLNEVFPNATVFINMPELKVKGLAYVRAIEACPVIADGSGSVVTARFATRSVSKIASVEIMGADGAIEVIRGTPNHPFWSLDRNDWVPLGELEEGEHLQGEAGVAFVLTHVIVNRSVPVYNIEVHGEHVYQVGELGFLVHNACPAPIGPVTPKVTDPKLGNLVSDLFKETKVPKPIGTGSTADAVRNELLTGLPTHGRFHSQKAQEYVNSLTNWLKKNPNASHQDQLVARSLIKMEMASQRRPRSSAHICMFLVVCTLENTWAILQKSWIGRRAKASDF